MAKKKEEAPGVPIAKRPTKTMVGPLGPVAVPEEQVAERQKQGWELYEDYCKRQAAEDKAAASAPKSAPAAEEASSS